MARTHDTTGMTNPEAITAANDLALYLTDQANTVYDLFVNQPATHEPALRLFSQLAHAADSLNRTADLLADLPQRAQAL